MCLHIAFPADFIYSSVADITEIGAILTGIFHGDEVSDLASVWGGKNNICAESEASYIATSKELAVKRRKRHNSFELRR